MDQICPKWIKLDQTGFPHQSKNITKNKNGRLIFDFFWIRYVQNGSSLIKLDQIGFPHQSKNVTIKSCHIYIKDKNDCFVFDFFGSDLSKMDQT